MDISNIDLGLDRSGQFIHIGEQPSACGTYEKSTKKIPCYDPLPCGCDDSSSSGTSNLVTASGTTIINTLDVKYIPVHVDEAGCKKQKILKIRVDTTDGSEVSRQLLEPDAITLYTGGGSITDSGEDKLISTQILNLK